MTTNPRSADVRERTWTREEYHRLGELGFFRGQRVELIGGALMVMSPQGAPHWSAMDGCRILLEALVGPAFLVRMQGPLDLGASSEPEPDIAVVAGARAQFRHAHPTNAVLIVEVAESTLAFDRGWKGSLYASAGILDYWIVNLVTPQVEVYRDPIPDANEPFGHRYAQRTDRLPGTTVSPLALPTVAIPVADLLP